MKKASRIARLLLAGWMLSCTFFVGAAQSADDSTAIARTKWTVVSDKEGIVCKKTRLRLFDSPQQISVVEIDPVRYRIGLAQDSLRTKTSVLGRTHGAVAAINGGYFKTGTRQAVASSVIKIDGELFLRMEGSDDGAALTIDRDGKIGISHEKTKAGEQPWYERYGSAIVAGPLLVANGRSLFAWEDGAQRHPRSCIGIEADGTVVLVVVDGRQDNAAGMSFCELAYTCRQLGMVAALNLDGGGSSTLWLRGSGVVNSVSDRMLIFPVERTVANAVLVLPRQEE